MNCNDYLPLLSGHLDGENSPEEEQRLQAHLAQCASCRARLQAFERGDRLLRADTAVPPAGLTASILAAAAKTPQRSVKKPRRAYWGGLATGLAAAALVVFTLLGPLKGFAQQKANDTAATAASGDVVMGYSGNITSFYHDAATSGVEAPECKAADTDGAETVYGKAAGPVLVVLRARTPTFCRRAASCCPRRSASAGARRPGFGRRTSAPHIACRRKRCQSFWRTAAGSTPSRSPLR